MKLTVNGVCHELEVAATERLIRVLRERLHLTGTKAACEVGECGACTVLMDGSPVLSCLILVGTVTGRVETIEGLAEEARPLREAFADFGGFQCGFCTPGMIVQGMAVLRAGLPPEDRELRRAMSGCICRCTGYQGIIAALRRVAGGPR